MKRHLVITASVVVLLLVGVAASQVATGIQAFGSFGGGPFDVVNLGNLNTHFDIPIIQKAGRGAPYVFTMSYDNSVWYPVTSSGTTTWTALANYGWNFTVPQYAFGYVTAATITSWQQPCNPPNDMRTVNVSIFGDFVYVDANATNERIPIPQAVRGPALGSNGRHPFPTTFLVSYQSILGCQAVTAPPTSGSSVAVDGSGYTVNAQGANGGVSAGIVATDGKSIALQQTSSTTTDANGNEVTSSTDVHGNMVVTDTLGQTVLTISGTNPVTMAYTAPAGPAAVTVNYGTFNIWTNFACSNITDPQINTQSLITSIALQDGTEYKFSYETNASHTAYTTGRLASVSLPTGGSIAYQYDGANDGVNCADGSTLGLQRTVTPGGTIEPQGIWTYSRSQMSGYWQTTVTSPPDPVNTGKTSDVTLIDFEEDGSHASQNFFETQRLVYQGSASGTPLESVTTCYNTNYSSCASSPVSAPISQTDVYTQLGSGGIRASEVQYNPYGLVTDDKEYNFGAALGSAPPSGDLVRETATSYASLGNGIAAAPSSVVVTDWSQTPQVTLSSTSYSYDQSTPTSLTGTPQHTSISGSRGNLTTVATQANTTTTLYQVLTYYDTGNVKSTTDLGTTSAGGSNVTSYSYANATSTCGNTFPTGVSEPLTLSKSFTWNCPGGVMHTATDENGEVATWDYTTDPDFWRPDSYLDPLQVNTTNYSYSTGPSASEAYLKFNGTTSVTDQRITLDGFGRVMLNQTAQSQALTNYDSVETDYDIMGRASRTTMPFQAAQGGTNLTAPATNTTYDALGRPLTITDGSGGTTTYSYINTGTNSDVLITTGSPTVKKQLEYDGLGRLLSVCEISTSGTLPGTGSCGQSNTQTGYWTQYSYDALGNLLKVNQNSQNNGTPQTRQFQYDELGRMTSETNPETGKNGVSGTTAYTYDVQCTTTPASPGDLTEKTDAAGNHTCYAYDGLHRLTDAGYNGPTCRRYRYDTQTPPSGVSVSLTLGRMAEAYTDNCGGTKLTDEWFGYDADGNLVDFYEWTSHSNGYYHSAATYWANGAVHALSVKNASASLIFPTIYYGTSSGGNGLDGEGRYLKVNGSSGTNPVTGVTYTSSGTSEPIGALTNVTYGSSDNDNYTYDTGTGRMKTYTFAINSVNDKGTLQWNTNGTLSQLTITDSLSGSSDSQTCNFYYDDLGRLGGKDSNNYSADCGSTKWQQLFSFDAFGNITKSGSSSFGPNYTFSNSAITNQFYSIPGTSVSYDGDGNLLTDNLNTYTWDPTWGNPATINGINLIYDALGQMVEQQNGSASTQILYSQMGKTAIMSAQTLTKAFVFLPGGGTAIYNSSGPTYYRHADWLGSSRLTSTPSRTAFASAAYAPYGEVYAKAGSSDPSFTGKNEDTTSTLYDFPFREYSSSQGRWISSDPAGAGAVDPANPQSWNRYAYVMNNPLVLIDPAGTCTHLTYDLAYWSDGPPTPVNVQITYLYDGPCDNPCGPGNGWAIVGGNIFCGPPANLGTIETAIQNMFNAGFFGPAYASGFLQSPKVCVGQARVLTGNPATVGKVGGTGVPVQSGSAAAIPMQFGFGHNQGYMFANQSISGTVGYRSFNMPTQSFSNVTDTIGSTQVANVQNVLIQRNPGSLILELVTGQDMGVVPVQLQVPGSMACPSGTSTVGPVLKQSGNG